MKSIQEMFPKASKSFIEANPQFSPVVHTSDAVAVNVAPRRGKMNKTEAEFAMILEARANHNEIKQAKFEQIKIRIGEGCWYIPDFFVERHVGKPLFIEIKGFLRDDARVKFLAAKELHTWADFEMWRKTKNGWLQIL